MSRFGGLLEARYGGARGLARLQLTRLAAATGVLNPWMRVRLPQVERVVFVCLGNLHRSPYAEAFARQLGLHAASIGLAAQRGTVSPDQSQVVAMRRGLSLAGHRATGIADFSFRRGDLLAVMETRHLGALLDRGFPRESLILLGAWARPRRLHLHDPHGLGPDYLRTCFAAIESSVRGLTRELERAGHPAALGTQGLGHWHS